MWLIGKLTNMINHPFKLKAQDKADEILRDLLNSVGDGYLGYKPITIGGLTYYLFADGERIDVIGPKPPYGYAKFLVLDSACLIMDIRVEQKMRSKGLGSGLLSYLEEIAKLLECKIIKGRVSGDPNKVYDFYVKNGFKIDKDEKTMFGMGVAYKDLNI